MILNDSIYEQEQKRTLPSRSFTIISRRYNNSECLFNFNLSKIPESFSQAPLHDNVFYRYAVTSVNVTNQRPQVESVSDSIFLCFLTFKHNKHP